MVSLLNTFKILKFLMSFDSVFMVLGIFSFIFTIINLVVRIFSLLLLNRELTDRGGNFIPSTTNRVQQTYEDIDRPNAQSPGAAQVTVTNLF